MTLYDGFIVCRSSRSTAQHSGWYYIQLAGYVCGYPHHTEDLPRFGDTPCIGMESSGSACAEMDFSGSACAEMGFSGPACAEMDSKVPVINP